jgi:hypothetical protein
LLQYAIAHSTLPQAQFLSISHERRFFVQIEAVARPILAAPALNVHHGASSETLAVVAHLLARKKLLLAGANRHVVNERRLRAGLHCCKHVLLLLAAPPTTLTAYECGRRFVAAVVVLLLTGQ